MKTDNEVIAEFMGLERCTDPNHKDDPCYLIARQNYQKKDGLKYDSSWDWLMPVVEKIKNTLNEKHKTMPEHSACQGDLIEVDIHCALHEVNISMVYKAVVEFINWYNTQPNTK